MLVLGFPMALLAEKVKQSIAIIEIADNSLALVDILLLFDM
jgi:hypothetical protein